MGQTMKKMAKGLAGYPDDSSTSSTSSQQVVPFVFKRRGSQYFDEDGDLAHEFYVQTRDSVTHKIRMKKLHKRRLRPQGDINYEIPRINTDLPIVLYEAGENAVMCR